MAAYLNNEWFVAIFCTALSALVGWPFAAILGLPVVLEMALVQYRRLLFTLLNYSFLSGGVLVILLVIVDTFFYGKPVLAPLNIVLYNVLSSHGPDLYGVEPLSYYLKNLILNWNVACVLTPLSVPVAGLAFSSLRSLRDETATVPLG
ncbi:hypothetical protein AB6A40_011589 [Gnathostoma spinigerum]|uniref:Mannosyltransferase n=1 Tax=Gnathostoma spinigerum TaxID=75299 RepID=A0ABD6EZG1_9BILA